MKEHDHWPYWVKILIGIDQLCNAIANGDPDETVSSRLGKDARKHNGVIPWSKPMNALLWRALERIDPGHCERSIEK